MPAAVDHACISKVVPFWADDPVGQALVIALGVVVGDEVVNGCPQRPLSKAEEIALEERKGSSQMLVVGPALLTRTRRMRIVQ